MFKTQKQEFIDRRCIQTINQAHSVGKTYNAMVDEAMFPGDAISLLLASNYLDCPSVGVDLCSITPFLLRFQEDKEDCP